MFLFVKPPSGAGKALACCSIALLLAGCSGLKGPADSGAIAIASETQPGSFTDSDAAGANVNPGKAQLASDSRHLDHEAVIAEAAIVRERRRVAEAEAIEAARREAEAAAIAAAEHEAETVAAIEARIVQIQQDHDAWHRLRQGMRLTPVHNKRVNAQLKWYLDHPGYLQRVMQRARPILPFVLDELERRDLPTELALLPIVESAYQAFAYSHGRASGLWQIIPSTGRYLGLKQNWWYDGRRDIIESTGAAITYLDSLAKQFDGDWELALAAYNAGPGKIRSAVRYNKKRKRPTDFWHLTRIRKETRDYVPKMFALKELFDHPEKYRLDLIPVTNEVSYEIVELDGQIDLALAAELADVTVNELYQLNPAFNRWATAPNGPHRLLLPRGKAEQFRVAVADMPASQRINWVRHKIRNGETLSHISRKYGTTVSLIREVNNLRGTQIRAGKYLMVPTATRSLQSYTLSQNSRIEKIQNTQRKGTRREHLVRPGESLWSISRSYGVSTRALAKWNGMAPIDTLRVGQKLVVWTRGNTNTLANIRQTRPSNSLHALRYTVRKGDSLYRIASKFNISVADIKRWNQVGKYLQPGQKLKLYVDITSQSS